MKKHYLDAQTFLEESWQLGRAVLDSGWRPDMLVALWRGGSMPGVAVHEFLSVKGLKLLHMPLVCSSYTGIGQQANGVRFIGEDSVFARLSPGMKVLVIDDVFDTGITADAVLKELRSRGCEARIACVYWKQAGSKVDFPPDYYVRTCDDWIVFPHEIDGLSREEITEKSKVLGQLMA